MIGAAGAIVIGALALATGAGIAEGLLPAEPESYRNDNYRAPTPATLRGARVISTADAERIWKAGSAAFVDVMPQISRPAGLPAGTLWRGQRRLSIPGSMWLADTGYGELSAAAEDYLRTGLERVTGGNRTRPLVFYCLKDCWMSWNAAKRAMSWGYTEVLWYSDGTDGWQEAGLPLVESTPAARSGE